MALSPFALRKGAAPLSRSVLAIVGGYIMSVVLIMVSLSFVAMLPLTVPQLLGTALALSYAVAVLSGYTAAAIARQQEITHALILSVVMIVLSMVNMNLEQGIKPTWWHIALILGLTPCTTAGAWLYQRRHQPRGLLRRLRDWLPFQ